MILCFPFKEFMQSNNYYIFMTLYLDLNTIKYDI